jgi:hypothetical protein
MKCWSTGLLLLAAMATACGGEPATDPVEPIAHAAVETAARPLPPGCTFSKGVTTCVTVTQQQVQSTRTVFSGCTVGPSFPPIPGRREQTFRDVTLVTTTTTTLQHGRAGSVFDTQTTTDTQLLSSTLISDVCVPI